MGLKLPPNFNVAEWVIDLASVDYSSEAAQRESTERVQQFVRAWQVPQRNTSQHTSEHLTIRVCVCVFVSTGPPSTHTRAKGLSCRGSGDSDAARIG